MSAVRDSLKLIGDYIKGTNFLNSKIFVLGDSESSPLSLFFSMSVNTDPKSTMLLGSLDKYLDKYDAKALLEKNCGYGDLLIVFNKNKNNRRLKEILEIAKQLEVYIVVFSSFESKDIHQVADFVQLYDETNEPKLDVLMTEDIKSLSKMILGK